MDDLAKAAGRATRTFESNLAQLASRAEKTKLELEESRASVQREREERDIEFSLNSGSTVVVEAPDTGALLERELLLNSFAHDAANLQRQFTEMLALSSTWSKQFLDGGLPPGHNAVSRAAVRSAEVEAQESERRRLAREVHDGPAQALANAVIALEFVERAIRSDGPDAVDRTLVEIERIKVALREGLTELRRFIFDLRPTMLQDRGLLPTIEHYVENYAAAYPVAIELTADEPLPTLSVDQELAVFRIVQESLQNIRKHARANSIAIEVATQSDALHVAISDDGRGFSPDRIVTRLNSGVGVHGMRERAKLVGGELFIDSKPGQGTRIDLKLPIAVQEDQHVELVDHSRR